MSLMRQLKGHTESWSVQSAATFSSLFLRNCVEEAASRTGELHSRRQEHIPGASFLIMKRKSGSQRTHSSDQTSNRTTRRVSWCNRTKIPLRGGSTHTQKHTGGKQRMKTNPKSEVKKKKMVAREKWDGVRWKEDVCESASMPREANAKSQRTRHQPESHFHRRRRRRRFHFCGRKREPKMRRKEGNISVGKWEPHHN